MCLTTNNSCLHKKYLNNETTTCNEQHVYLMWRVSTSWRKQSTASSSNMVHERLVPHIELKRTDPDSLLIAVMARALLPAVTGIALGEEWCELSDKVMSLYFQDNSDYLSWTCPHIITKWLQEICISPPPFNDSQLRIKLVAESLDLLHLNSWILRMPWQLSNISTAVFRLSVRELLKGSVSCRQNACVQCRLNEWSLWWP